MSSPIISLFDLSSLLQFDCLLVCFLSKSVTGANNIINCPVHNYVCVAVTKCVAGTELLAPVYSGRCQLLHRYTCVGIYNAMYIYRYVCKCIPLYSYTSAISQLDKATHQQR